MEKEDEKKLCRIRDIYRSISLFEDQFEQKYGICLNEGMLLCSLRENKYSSSELADLLGLTNSNTSKVIKLVEKKGLVERNIGKDDKRQMYFSLSEVGKQKLKNMNCQELQIPEILMPLMAR